MSTKPLTQEELKQLNQETRDSIRGKNNYQPGGPTVTGRTDDNWNFQENDYQATQFNERYN